MSSGTVSKIERSQFLAPDTRLTRASSGLSAHAPHRGTPLACPPRRPSELLPARQPRPCRRVPSLTSAVGVSDSQESSYGIFLATSREPSVGWKRVPQTSPETGTHFAPHGLGVRTKLADEPFLSTTTVRCALLAPIAAFRAPKMVKTRQNAPTRPKGAKNWLKYG